MPVLERYYQNPSQEKNWIDPTAAGIALQRIFELDPKRGRKARCGSVSRSGTMNGRRDRPRCDPSRSNVGLKLKLRGGWNQPLEGRLEPAGVGLPTQASSHASGHSAAQKWRPMNFFDLESMTCRNLKLQVSELGLGWLGAFFIQIGNRIMRSSMGSGVLACPHFLSIIPKATELTLKI